MTSATVRSPLTFSPPASGARSGRYTATRSPSALLSARDDGGGGDDAVVARLSLIHI